MTQRVGWNRCACALGDGPGAVCEGCGGIIGLQAEGHHWHLVPSRRLRLYEDFPTGLLYHAECGRQQQEDNERRKIEEAPEEAMPLGGDQIEILLDLARDGDETAFRELARCLGVKKEKLDGMWTGTRRRVGH